jgi:hypothetical protein
VPRKAKWLRFQTDPGYSFDFYLAAKLHRTVAEMHRTISNDEYMAWNVYYAREQQDRQLARR